MSLGSSLSERPESMNRQKRSAKYADHIDEHISRLSRKRRKVSATERDITTVHPGNVSATERDITIVHPDERKFDTIRKRQDVEKICHVDRLPPEIRRMIFSHLQLSDRKTVRRVCKSWYDTCNENENIRIPVFYNPDDEYIENCGMRDLNVRFDNALLNEWPATVWEKIGSRVKSLCLYNCRVDDQTMKHIISSCDNLRVLKVKLKNADPGQSFCSPDVLEKLDLVRNKLETLAIHAQWCRYFKSSVVNLDAWKRIFFALFRIYPNVKHYSSGLQDEDDLLYFSCKFSAKSDEINKSELSYCMAFLLSDEIELRSIALGVFVTSRFTAFSLILSRFVVPQLQTNLDGFFEKQNKLESVKVKVGIGRGLRTPTQDESEILKSLALQIVHHCCNLRELEFYESKRSDRSVECVSWLTQLFAPNEPSAVFLAKLSNIEKLSFDSVIQRSSLTLALSWRKTHCRRNTNITQDSISRDFIKNYAFIEHLTMVNDVSNKMLQTVFQFMNRLKTLKIRLGAHNTSFGLTGRWNSAETGYSIRCLQNLEKLTICSHGFIDFDDCTFDEFEFPKLHYLHCIPPKLRSTLHSLLLKLPALEEIGFSLSVDASLLCGLGCCTKKIHTINLLRQQQLMNDRQVKMIFDTCLPLKFIRTRNRTFLYEPFTGEVRCIRRSTAYSYSDL